MENAGAVALIGNSAATYLNFSVAMITGNQNPFAGFTPDQMGLYDAMMHPDYNSIGQILNEEKIAAERVTGMGEELISWHIYAMNILGDPSINPFIGIPQDMNAIYEFYSGADPLIIVQAAPGAYFAVTDENHVILGTGFTGEDGNGFTDLDPINTDVITLCITAKNKIPFLEDINVTEINQNQLSPEQCELVNYPNPFNLSTTIFFNLTTEITNNIKIVIYNLKGQKIRDFTMSNISMGTSEQNLFWDGTDQNNQPVTTGIYYAVLKQNNKNTSVRKMLLMK